MNIPSDQNSGANSGPEKRVLYSTVARALLMGAALVATIWTIGMLNSGSLFNGGSSTATLLGIPASRGH